MIIDFHTHTFPEFLAPKVIPKLEKGSCLRAQVDGTLVGLENSMKEAGVDISILLPVATKPSQVMTCNNGAYELNMQEQNSFLSFGTMHPEHENYKEELVRMRDMGLKGLKLHPDYQQTFFDDIKYKRIIDKASELGLITLVHAGLDIGLPDPIHATPKMIQNLIREVQPEKLVLAHMGGFALWEEVIERLAGENVYLDTAFSLGEIHYLEETPTEKRMCSMMNTELFMQMVSAFGEDKILFATDSPWGNQRETLDIFTNLPLSAVQKNKILGENAVALLLI